MQLRVVIFGSDGRGSRNLDLSLTTIVVGALVMVTALASVLWLGWKIGELTARL
jgi:hypothetical protein